MCVHKKRLQESEHYLTDLDQLSNENIYKTHDDYGMRWSNNTSHRTIKEGGCLTILETRRLRYEVV